MLLHVFSQRDLWLIFNRWAKGSHITSSAEKVPVAGSIHGFVWTCWGGKTLVLQNMFENHFPFLDYHFEGIPWYNTYSDTPRSIPTTCILMRAANVRWCLLKCVDHSCVVLVVDGSRVYFPAGFCCFVMFKTWRAHVGFPAYFIQKQHQERLQKLKSPKIVDLPMG